jgi:DNA-binding CsgD family transcriptional regulator
MIPDKLPERRYNTAPATTLRVQRSGNILILQRYLLTYCELMTLMYISHGMTTRDIATTLGLSTETIDTHRRNIIRKLRAHNIVQAVAFCIRNRIIE